MILENVTIADGQKYKPDEEIWDLGSFVATSGIHKKRNYEGLSKDIEKLPHYVDTGSSAFCLDTGDYYKYLRSTDTWYKIKGIQSSSSGGGVSDYKDLNGKPQINGVTLQGNLTLEDLGIKETNTPIGEIISFMGNTAPKNYLVCDGAEYNISEYQELANHFTEEFGSANYFGGDGETTFSVPDLRGEFLRGSGTAARNTGTGVSVGNHQDATSQMFIGYNKNDPSFWVDTSILPDNKNTFAASNYDKISVSSSNVGRSVHLNDWSGAKGTTTFTSRPTNTSVLYCIKYKSTPSNSSTDNEIITYKDISNEISLTSSNLELNYAYIENNIINISVQGTLPVGRNTFAKILNEKYKPRYKIFGIWYPCIDETDISKVTYLQIDEQGDLYAYVARSLNNIVRMNFSYPMKTS